MGGWVGSNAKIKRKCQHFTVASTLWALGKLPKFLAAGGISSTPAPRAGRRPTGERHSIRALQDSRGHQPCSRLWLEGETSGDPETTTAHGQPVQPLTGASESPGLFRSYNCSVLPCQVYQADGHAIPSFGKNIPCPTPNPSVPRETNSVGYLRWTSADLSSEGSGCTMNRNTQEEQNGKMPESNLRVHGSSRAAPSTAASRVQGTT